MTEHVAIARFFRIDVQSGRSAPVQPGTGARNTEVRFSEDGLEVVFRTHGMFLPWDCPMEDRGTCLLIAWPARIQVPWSTLDPPGRRADVLARVRSPSLHPGIAGGGPGAMYDRRSGLLLWHTMAEAPVGVPQGLYAMLGDPDVTDRLRRSGVDVAALERAAETHRSAPGSEKAWRDALPCPEPFDIGNPAHVGSVTVEGLLGALLAQPDLAAVWARVGRPEPLAPTAPLAPVTGPHLVVWRDDETPFGFLVELLHEALDISRFEAMRAAVRVDAEGLARVSVPTRVVLEQAVALIREIAGMAGYPLRVEVGSAIGGVP